MDRNEGRNLWIGFEWTDDSRVQIFQFSADVHSREKCANEIASLPSRVVVPFNRSLSTVKWK